MAPYRTYTVEFKRRLAEEHLSGGVGLSELARPHDISRELLRIWVKVRGRRVRQWRVARRACEVKIAGLERKEGQLTMELDLLKKRLISARRARGGTSSIVSGPKPAASEPGPESALSTYYYRAKAKSAEAAVAETADFEEFRHVLDGWVRSSWR